MTELSGTEIRRWLTAKEIGRELEIHERIDSTNNRAKALAAAAKAIINANFFISWPPELFRQF